MTESHVLPAVGLRWGWHMVYCSLHEAEQRSRDGLDPMVLDVLRTPKERIRQQVGALRRGSHLPYRERLARRLEFLLRALEEEKEPLAEDSPESLRQMLLFLEALPEFRCPTVTVTLFATFRAQWRAHPSEHFAVDFVPDGQVRFVVFAPDPSHPGRVDRVSGIVSPANAIKAIETYQVHRWAADASLAS